MTAPLLQTRSLSRDFGGVHAVQDVSLTVETARIHAVIGPNGAGKTTLINLLSGDMKPSRGEARFRDTDITSLSPERVARLGIGRSYQQTHVIGDMTCLENCCLGARDDITGMGFFRPAARYADTIVRAQVALEQMRMTDRADIPAAALSHGEKRQLEIAMVLASGPELLLLDEPLAGMGTGESRRMVDLLKMIATTHTVVLVEHDMDAVFELADVLTVMVDGQVLKTGTPEDVRADTRVQRAYLGETA